MESIAITALYAGLLGLLFVALSVRVVVSVRAKGNVLYGDGGNPEFNTIVRGQANFAEYVPIALILMGLVEMEGASNTVMHAMGIGLLAGRIVHPMGLTNNPGVNPLRVIGTTLSWLVIVVASVLAIRGYWA